MMKRRFQQAIEAWERFWFTETSSEILAWIRIAAAATVIMKMLGLHGLYRIGNWRIVWPWERNFKASEFVGTGEYVPKLDALAWVPDLDVDTSEKLVGVMFGLGVLMLFGVATRVVVPLLALTLGWTMFYTSMDYRHHENVMFWTLVALSVAPCADHHAVDAWLFPNRPATRPIAYIRMLQVLLTTIYFSTTLGKLDWGWWTGAAMQAIHDEGHFRGPFWPTLWNAAGPVFFSRYTVFAEGLCAIGFWIPRIRWGTALVGAGLHLGIDFMMPVTTFSFQMISLYAVFAEPSPGSFRSALAPSALLAGAKRASNRILFRRG